MIAQRHTKSMPGHLSDAGSENTSADCGLCIPDLPEDGLPNCCRLVLAITSACLYADAAACLRKNSLEPCALRTMLPVAVIVAGRHLDYNRSHQLAQSMVREASGFNISQDVNASGDSLLDWLQEEFDNESSKATQAPTVMSDSEEPINSPEDEERGGEIGILQIPPTKSIDGTGRT